MLSSWPSHYRLPAVFAAGLLSPLAFAPFHLWPLQIISLLIFLLLLSNSRRPLLEGWFYGCGFFALGSSWVYVSIHQFGSAPVWLAGLLTVLFVLGVGFFFSLPAWLTQKLCRSRRDTMLLVFPAIWVLGEGFRTVFLTGFPWLLSGYAALDTPLQHWAPVIGVYGLSFQFAMTAAALLVLSRPGRTNRAIAIIVLILLVGSSWQWQDHAWARPTGKELPVTLIQGNIDQNLKWQSSERQGILNSYTGTTLNTLPGRLIIWPETAVPLLFDQALSQLTPLSEALIERGSALITGVPVRERDVDTQQWRYFNAIQTLGIASGRYNKQRLVPFGEYVPLEQQLRGLIRFFDLPMSNFSLGKANQPPLHALDFAVAASICYEIVYPELIRKGALISDVLLTISNDAWFGDSLAPHQHLQMARMRALENGRYLIRATNNGITAVINQQGQVVDQLPQFKTAELNTEIPQLSGTTPFTRIGSVPIFSLSTLILLCATAGVWKRKSKASKERPA